MAKDKIIRKGGHIQRDNQIETYAEEHYLRDNSPIPSPEELQRYKDIDPQLVEVFIKAWQEEREHRYELSKGSLEVVRSEAENSHKRQLWGMRFAFASLLGFLALVFYALYLNNLWFAGIVGAFCIGTIVTTFVNAHKSEQQSKI